MECQSQQLSQVHDHSDHKEKIASILEIERNQITYYPD